MICKTSLGYYYVPVAPLARRRRYRYVLIPATVVSGASLNKPRTLTMKHFFLSFDVLQMCIQVVLYKYSFTAHCRPYKFFSNPMKLSNSLPNVMESPPSKGLGRYASIRSITSGFNNRDGPVSMNKYPRSAKASANSI